MFELTLDDIKSITGASGTHNGIKPGKPYEGTTEEGELIPDDNCYPVLAGYKCDNKG